MKKFFSTDAARILKSDKAIISLAQGKPVEGAAPPQLLPLFAAPLAPPATATVAVWKNYHLFMVGFWYRVKFGFAIYKQMTKEEGKWLELTIKYFDMIANGFFFMYSYLHLFEALESFKTFSWTDAKTYVPAYLSGVKVRMAYAMLWWLFNQNTLDVLIIEEQLGVVPVDSKVKAWYAKWTPWAMGWAFMHWEASTDFTKWGVWFDGTPWDAAKGYKLTALWFQKKLALAMRGIFYALVADGMPQQEWLMNLLPWLGFSLSYDAMGISFFSSLAAAPPSSLKADHKAARQTNLIAADQTIQKATEQKKEHLVEAHQMASKASN